MKLAVLILAAASVVAAAQTPSVLATLTNKAGGKITFTSERGGRCPTDQMFVYAQSAGGKIEITGCYKLIGDNLFVVWADGDVYTYPFSDLEPSQEFRNYAGKQL